MGHVGTAAPAFLLLFSLPPLACVGGIDRDYYADVDRILAQGREQSAAEMIQEAGRDVYGDRNRLLYHMDMGLALQLAGEYERSASHFEAADSLGHDLYTRSLTSEAGSLFTSDLLIPYAGEEFERVLVNVFNSLNYAFLNRFEDALVEVRRIDAKFREYARSADGGRYAADGFAQYLSGLLYEAAGELDDALIAYRRALDTYLAQVGPFGHAPPRELAQDVVRLARLLDASSHPEAAGLAGEVPSLAGFGEIVVVHYFGPGPRKEERLIEVSLGRGLVHAYAVDVQTEDQKRVTQALSVAKSMAATTQVTVAYPIFEQPDLAARWAQVEVPGCEVRGTAPVEDVSAIARINLEDRLSREWPRIVARAVLKFVTARAAGKASEEISGNQMVGLLVQAISQGAMSASEAADIRGWRTLPALIQLTRVRCRPGTWDVTVRHGGGRRGRRYHFPQVGVTDGGKTFVLANSY